MERYRDAYCYAAKVPVKQLAFDVTVWSAPLVDEANRTVLSQRRVMWAMKIPSPQEAIEYMAYAEALAAGGSAAASAPKTGTLSDVQELHHAVEATTVSLPPGSGPLDPALPPPTPAERLVAYLALQGGLFTRPPAEDFVNPDDEALPVDPPQDPTPLARLHLRRHREERLPCPYFHLMYALGRTTIGAKGAPVFDGAEVVLTTLVGQSDSGSLIAYPPLNAVHTLYVDERSIFTFLVCPAKGPAVTRGVGAAAVAPGGATGALRSVVSSANLAQLVSNRAASRRASMLLGPGQGGGDGTAMDATGFVPHPAAFGPDSARSDGTDSSLTATVASSASSTADAEAERERIRMLRAAIMATNAAGTGSAGGIAVSLADFTPPPKGAGEARVHVMGTIECVRGIHRDACYIRYSWILPPDGISEDRATNQKAGVAHVLTATSQVAFASRVVNREYLHETTHQTNFPFELHVVLSDTATAAALRLVIEVCSGCDGVSHESPEGYALVSVPPMPGQRRQSAGLWRPKKTGFETLKAAFIGGGPSLADIVDVAVPAHHTGPLNAARAGLQTETVGFVDVQWMVLVQVAPRTAMASDSPGGAGILSSGSPLTVGRRRGMPL